MKKLLVVVDMQNDFIDGSLGSLEAQNIVEPVRSKIELYKENGDEVIFTLDTHGADYQDTIEGKKLPVVHCIKGTHGWELDKRLQAYTGIRFEKDTFGSMACAQYVKENEYESVELVGLCTDICVISNALLLKAAVPSVPIKVDPHCCAGVTLKSHQTALEAMKMCQIELTSDMTRTCKTG